MSDTKGLMRNALGFVAVAVATVASWLAWLGWDTTKDLDPVTSNYSGPYEVWQVAACVLSLIVIAAVGGLLMRPWIVVLAMTVPFTLAWSAQAASADDSGLWAVGATMILFGLGGGSTLVVVLARAIRSAFGGGASGPVHPGSVQTG